MTYEEVKNLLKNIRGKKSRLKALKSYIDEERALIEGIGAVSYDKVAVKTSQNNSTEERYIKYLDRLKDLQNRFDVLMDDMCQEEDIINDLMKRLSPTEYEVILNRYLRGLSVNKTARIMNYSVDGIYDIQERSIKKMCKT